ncbi:MAG: TrkA family potassium uptake protein [Candidatus Actinomarinales bacterium]|nr:MAG: TrkA family potassium uptake protein [Candidatus Actinomarinales bacterium]
MKVLIAGANGIAEQLIQRIGSGWEISVVDIDQEILREFASERKVEKIQGDASSNLVLKKAGLESSGAVIALTDNDDVNIEVVKLAKDAEVPRISARVVDIQNESKYKKLDIDTVISDNIAARQLEHLLEPRRVASKAFAGGRAEAIELEIESGSPASGKQLKEIGSDSFIVGALLRGSSVIIPHGDTLFQTGDLVTVVVQAGAFSEVVDLFSGSESRFPLYYGKNVAVVMESVDHLGALSEAEEMVINTQADSLYVYKKEGVFEDNIESDEDSIGAVASNVDLQISSFPKISNKVLDREIANTSIGILVVPLGTNKDSSIIKNYINFSKKNKIPVLFSRNSNPYTRIGIKLSSDLTEESTSKVALDLCQKMGSSIVAFEIKEAEFLSSDTPSTNSQDLMNLEDSARYKGVEVKHEEAEGNVAKELANKAESVGLFILDTTGSSSWQKRKTTEFISINSNISILVVPSED